MGNRRAADLQYAIPLSVTTHQREMPTSSGGRHHLRAILPQAPSRKKGRA
jgi:hypothetical protein